jgi:hypothetical protein
MSYERKPISTNQYPLLRHSVIATLGSALPFRWWMLRTWTISRTSTILSDLNSVTIIFMLMRDVRGYWRCVAASQFVSRKSVPQYSKASRMYPSQSHPCDGPRITTVNINNSQLQGRNIATRTLQTVQHVRSSAEAPVPASMFYSAPFAGTLHDPAELYPHNEQSIIIHASIQSRK